MHVEDFKGRVSVSLENELTHRLQSVRDGDYGAFILSHQDEGPNLWVHVNKEVAYLHYFPHGRHPGFQAWGMTPSGVEDYVRFRQVGDVEADAVNMPGETVVPIETAYKAAVEFFNNPDLPKSVRWTEL
jgi:hypothetical protein